MWARPCATWPDNDKTTTWRDTGFWSVRWVLAFHDPLRAQALVDTDDFDQASRESTSLA